VRARALAPVAVLALLGAARDPAPALRAAERTAIAAEARAARLEARADAEAGDARRAALRETAVAARIRAAAAAVAVAELRVADTDRQLALGGARLVRQQAPLTRLVAAVQSLARRPAAIAVIQPGSAADIVHARALLGTMLPVIAARTAAVRGELDRMRDLRAGAADAAATLARGRAGLASQHLALARLEGRNRLAGARQGGVESDRAIALGEGAREVAALMATTAAAADVRASLSTLSGPLPRPGDSPATPRFTRPPYRLPAVGRIVDGVGELSDTGVRSRGLTLATAPGARVVAPAAGRVVFARGFRGYGTVVILDHGGGWSTTLTGLDSAAVAAGGQVYAGQPIGRAAMADAPRITVELRRRGTPADLTQLIG